MHPRLPRHLIALCVTASLTGFAAAQQFESRALSPVPNARYAAAADFDGDGDADVLGSTSAGIGIAVNDGQNRFPTVRPISGRVVSVLTTVDVDRDGDPDVLGLEPDAVTRQNAPILLRNDGATFTDVTATNLPAGIGRPSPASLVLLDLDADGDDDLLLLAASPLVLVNDGTGTFADQSTTWTLPAFQFVQAVGATDVDGDGRDDLVVVDSQVILVLRNAGTAFVDETAQRLPPGFAPPAITIAAADVDGDGDADLLLNTSGPVQKVLLRNDSGVYTDVSSTQLPATTFGTHLDVIVDVDGDGDPDVLDRFGRLLVNDGAGTFVLGATQPTLGGPLVAADAEGDGDQDVFAVGTALEVLRNDANGSFTRSSAADVTFAGTSVWFDADRDGDVDLAAGTQLLRNDGTGGFQSVALGVGIAPNPRPAVGDFDGDGDLDVVGRQLLRNDGTGSFTQGPLLPANSSADLERAVADFDGDGDLDLVGTLGALGSPVLFRNDGTGTFTADATVFPTTPWSLRFEAGDVDGDGDPDVLLAWTISTNAPRVLLNQGGQFVAGPPLLTVAPGTARFVRVVPGQPPDVLTAAGTLFRLQGGAFVDVTAATFPFGALPAIPGDVDGDGDVDLLAVGSAPQSGLLARNDGTGRFGPWESSGLRAVAATVVDVDGDGDGDVATATEVWWNRERQVALPLPPHTGRPLHIEVWSRPGRANAFDVAMLGIGAARLAVPQRGPFGVLHLDAVGAILPVAIAPGVGRADVDLPVPNVASLRGLEVWFQALHWTAGGLHFSNIANARVE